MNDRTDELQRYQWGAMGMRQDNSQFGTMHYYRGFDVELLVTSQAAEIAELRAGNELLVASLERTPSQAAEIERLREQLRPSAPFTDEDGCIHVRETPTHVCGLTGYNRMIDPPCPACEEPEAGDTP